MSENNNLEIATIGGGCFWCVEAVFQYVNGVHKVVSGYSGGHIKNPCYREISTKTTGHAEVVQIHFDPDIVSYAELLEMFWATHDPTTPNQQGNDRGPQYRSIIMYHSERQKEAAEHSITEVATKYWDDPIVTELVPFDVFYNAEGEHQNFYQNNQTYPYCQVIINPKVAKLKAKFRDKLKTN